MNRLALTLAPLLFVSGCGGTTAKSPPAGADPDRPTLAQARRDFHTTLTRQESVRTPAAQQPRSLMQTVRFQSPVGELVAYLSTMPPGGNKKYPAIVWISGGLDNSIGLSSWAPGAWFRESGVVALYPSFRGGNDNPGFREVLLGEVDDVLAAADFLAAQRSVDPTRIYLGGHGTGGTLALLAAECSDRFRATFAVGPVDTVTRYQPEELPFNVFHPREAEVRSPIHWLGCIRSPVFVFEGTQQPGNLACLEALAQACTNPAVHFYPVPGADHYGLVAPLADFIGRRIAGDAGPETNIAFTPRELEKVVGR
jgi:pimeloyl-ACP methyl ester carboxylesterase